MTRLLIDADQICIFATSIFKHASDGQIISLRTFRDDAQEKPLNIHAVTINGGGLEPVVEAAVMQAQWAADHSKRAVFCPPIAGFSSEAKADEAHLTEGYALTVECDKRPAEARKTLERVLGPATIAVESGGLWSDPGTGEVQDKLHLHWRLATPAIGGDLKRLKHARRLAAELVGADTSNVPIVHPVRWPGSMHRKGEPRLARIVAQSECEVSLDAAIAALEQAQPEKAKAEPGNGSSGQRKEREDKRTIAELNANITSGKEFHTSIVALASRLIGGGMKGGAVVNHIRELMEEAPRDWRWQARYDAVPNNVRSAEEKFGRAGVMGQGEGLEGAAAQAVELDCGTITQDGVARVFAARYADRLRYCHSSGAWYGWAGTHWRKDETDIAFQFARRLGREFTEGAKPTDIKEARKISFAGGVERFARGDAVFARTIKDWDRDPLLLGTPGGTVDLRTGFLRTADPADSMTKIAAVAPAEAADCSTWLRFLNEATGSDVGLIRFLRQWCGYCLTGITREHALVFVYGPGGNGKGTFLNVLTGIMGDYATAAAIETFTASKFDRHPTEIAALRGARAVTASETENGRAWAESRIKQLTGGDTMKARFMRQDEFEFVPVLKLIVIGNHKPVLHNVDDAMRRRFNIVPFTRKPAQPDHHLDEKLRAEWPGILRWMIEGCLDWQVNGLVRSQSVLSATEDYFGEQDIFSHWLEEACDVEPGNQWKSAKVGDLYESWAAFARASGEDGGTKKGFGAELEKRHLERTKGTGGVRTYSGIRLKPSNPYDLNRAGGQSGG